MKILAVFPGKIGDALFFSYTIRYYKAMYPDAEIDWVYGSPTIDDFIKFMATTDLPVNKYIPYRYGYKDDFKEWAATDWSSVFPGYDKYLNATLGEAAQMHLIEWIPFRSNVIKLKPGELLPNPPLIVKEPSKGSGKDKILVHPWIPFPERQCKWLMYLYPQYRDYKVHSIGLKDEPMVPNTVDFRGKPYSDYIDLIRSARLVVGLASSWVALAGALGVPSIMVHAISRPGQCGISRFGPQRIDMVRPFIYDIEGVINELLSLQPING